MYVLEIDLNDTNAYIIGVLVHYTGFTLIVKPFCCTLEPNTISV